MNWIVGFREGAPSPTPNPPQISQPAKNSGLRAGVFGEGVKLYIERNHETTISFFS
jgi:hypothetical protein